MKYKLFRSPGNLDKAVQKHELDNSGGQSSSMEKP